MGSMFTLHALAAPTAFNFILNAFKNITNKYFTIFAFLLGQSFEEYPPASERAQLLLADRGMDRCVVNVGTERFPRALTEHGHDLWGGGQGVNAPPIFSTEE